MEAYEGPSNIRVATFGVDRRAGVLESSGGGILSGKHDGQRILRWEKIIQRDQFGVCRYAHIAWTRC